jgi:hypothetical protein
VGKAIGKIGDVRAEPCFEGDDSRLRSRLQHSSWEAVMNSFFEHHKDSIRWHYRCFDRILLNGLFNLFSSRSGSSASSMLTAKVES